MINTRALILQHRTSGTYYLHVYDGWLRIERHRRAVDAGLHRPVREERARRDRAVAREGRHGRPPRRRRQGQPEAVARQRRADDLHQPGADRADRLQGPAGLRADRGHATPVGGEHDERRADRHQQQPLLRADGRALVPLGRADGSLVVRRQRRAAGGLRAHPAAFAGRGGAADGGRHAAGAGGGDLQLDPADGDGAAEGRPDVHAELRRSAAVRADPGDVAVVRGQLARSR